MNRRLIRPGIAYVDSDQSVIDFTDDEAAFVLDHDPRIALEWRKWTGEDGAGEAAGAKWR